MRYDPTRRCWEPGCAHHWPAHSGQDMRCTVSGCECGAWRESVPENGSSGGELQVRGGDR